MREVSCARGSNANIATVHPEQPLKQRVGRAPCRQYTHQALVIWRTQVNRSPGSETKLVTDYYQTFLPKQGRMAPSDVRHVAVQVLNALSYMHEKQIAHLAVQPRNVMCRVRDSSVKLIHFKRACYPDDKQKLRVAPDSGPGLRWDSWGGCDPGTLNATG